MDYTIYTFRILSGGVGPDAVGRVEGATVSNCRINRLWVGTQALPTRNPGSVEA
ncbi:hypothetical protein ACIXBV_01820 [Bacteroides fragilis]|uniref:hypothetical protein n=1 Tax=Bacteroides fragilis TaxID=817 RepID=UPI0016490E39|nr:hypothetical protein [Bacteroides fragilis]MCS2692726.1 hypothetical protein [Bacteroides fragilis]